ncbi:MAG: GNAT family N-acetyltransferase [Actinomycetota bacterium]
MTATERERIQAMMRWVAEASATRVEPWRLGTAIYTEDFPGRYDSNFVRVERSVGSTTPAELAAEVDDLLAGVRHRELYVEDLGEGARLAAGFRDLGFAVDRLVSMVQSATPTDNRVLPTVEEVDATAVRQAVMATHLAIAGSSREDAEMLADFRLVSEQRTGTRFFAARLDGELAAYCELYLHEGAAQIEDVNTLVAHRNRGAGRAVVLAAAVAGRAAGADLVWLLADEDDWPRHLYAKLGFEALGGCWQFTKMAPEHQAQMQSESTSVP